MQKYIVKANVKEQSAKDYLKRHENISSSLWKKIKQQNEFFLNGQKTPPTRAFVKPGDIIEYNITEQSKVIPTDLPFTIRYEDEYLLIADKPAGMLTHPLTFEAENTLANAVMYHFQKTGQQFGCHPLYRLDRNTSGLVVFAKLPQLQYLFGGNHQKLKRYYLAIVHGNITPPDGTVDAPIGRMENSIIMHQVTPDDKKAVTHYHTLKTCQNRSLIELNLETGRTHQIRVHMSHIGHPLLGDDLYGGKRDLIMRHALHAYKLQFIHPFTHEEIIIENPLPADMLNLL